MIKDIISFEIASQKFAVDFQKTPIILRAKDYLNPSHIGAGLSLDKIHFENEVIELIDLANILNFETLPLSDSSRILVGEIGGVMFGLLVDKVVEIINLSIEFEDFENTISVKEYIDVSSEKLRVINVNDLLRKSNLNINMGS